MRALRKISTSVFAALLFVLALCGTVEAGALDLVSIKAAEQACTAVTIATCTNNNNINYPCQVASPAQSKKFFVTSKGYYVILACTNTTSVTNRLALFMSKDAGLTWSYPSLIGSNTAVLVNGGYIDPSDNITFTISGGTTSDQFNTLTYNSSNDTYNTASYSTKTHVFSNGAEYSYGGRNSWIKDLTTIYSSFKGHTSTSSSSLSVPNQNGYAQCMSYTTDSGTTWSTLRMIANTSVDNYDSGPLVAWQNNNPIVLYEGSGYNWGASTRNYNNGNLYTYFDGTKWNPSILSYCYVTSPITDTNSTTITVDDTSSFPATGGVFNINSERIAYGGLTATTFYSCTRGYTDYLGAATTKATHAAKDSNGNSNIAFNSDFYRVPPISCTSVTDSPARQDGYITGTTAAPVKEPAYSNHFNSICADEDSAHRLHVVFFSCGDTHGNPGGVYYTSLGSSQLTTAWTTPQLLYADPVVTSVLAITNFQPDFPSVTVPGGGSNVYVVWQQNYYGPVSSRAAQVTASAICYKVSTNSGATWSSAVTIMDAGKYERYPVTMRNGPAAVPIYWQRGADVLPAAATANLMFAQIIQAPIVTGVSPLSALNGSSISITVTGTGFYGNMGSSVVTNIKLDDINATNVTVVTVSSDTSLIGVIPSGVSPGTYSVRVQSLGGTNLTSTQKIFLDSVRPAVNSVTPSAGYASGYRTVSISGSGFFSGTGTGKVTSISIGSQTPVINLGFTVPNDSTINNVIVPKGYIPGTYNVYTTTNGGTNTTTTLFTVAFGVDIQNISPSSGSNTTPTVITMLGRWFTGATNYGFTVTGCKLDDLAGTSLTAFSLVDDQHLIATVPPQVVAGNYSVRVSSGAGSNYISTAKFSVTTTPPTVTSATPVSGSYDSAMTLSVTGAGFFGGSVATPDVIGITLQGLSPAPNVSLSSYSVSSDTAISAVIVPVHTSPGTYDVLVTTHGGSSSAGPGTRIAITGTIPVVNTISPSTWVNTTFASPVTITGFSFSLGAAGNISLKSSSVSIQNPYTTTSSGDTILYTSLPAGIPAGTYDVLAPIGTGINATSAMKFLSSPVTPAIITITPSTAVNLGAATLTVRGSGFFGGVTTLADPTAQVESVRIDNGVFLNYLTGISVLSDTSLKAVLPAGSKASRYNLVVKLTGGPYETVNGSATSITVTTALPALSSVAADTPSITNVPNSGDYRTGWLADVTGAGLYGGSAATPDISAVLLTSTSGVIVTLTGGNVRVQSDAYLQMDIPGDPLLACGRYFVQAVNSQGTSSTTAGVYWDALLSANTAGSAIGNITHNTPVINIGSSTITVDAALIIQRVSAGSQGALISADAANYTDLQLPGNLSATEFEVLTSVAIGDMQSGGNASITVSYASLGINDPEFEQNIRLAKIINGRWQIIPGNQLVDMVAKTVTANVSGFSVFRVVMSVSSASDLSNAAVFPNPVDLNIAVNNSVKFINLTANPTIKIYTVSGERVRTLQPGTSNNMGNDGRAVWDGKNENGERVARGLYICLISDGNGNKKVIKIAVL